MNVAARIGIGSMLALSATAGVWCSARAGRPPVATIADAGTDAPIQTPPTPTPPPPAPPAQTPATPIGADPEWDRAMAMKKRAAYLDAAKAFDDYARLHPESPRAHEALVEAGVGWFTTARARMKLNQNTTESLDAFKTALGYFEKVSTMDPPSAFGGRAQYMRGSSRLFMGEMEKAESEYGLAFDKFKSDAKYAPKSLERRAAVRRHLLRTKDAAADYELYQKLYPKGEDAEIVAKYLSYCATFEKPAPALSAEAWIQGEPTTIDAMRGELVGIYFFAMWCPHCEEFRESLLGIIDHYEPLGVHFIGVVDHSEGQTVDSVRAGLPAKKITFPVIMDTMRTRGAYHGDKIPDLVLIDRAGRVRWHDNPNNLNVATLEKLLLDDSTAAKPADKTPSKPK